MSAHVVLRTLKPFLGVLALVLAACGPDGGDEEPAAVSPSKSDLAQQTPEQCGAKTCPMGQVCCNESCGICVEPGGSCTQQLCATAPTTCASDADCASGEVCLPGPEQTCGLTACAQLICQPAVDCASDRDCPTGKKCLPRDEASCGLSACARMVCQ